MCKLSILPLAAEAFAVYDKKCGNLRIRELSAAAFYVIINKKITIGGNTIMAVLLTSGYNFEGYKIKKYMGFCSGECVLGTGFFSALNAGVADFLGSNSSMYEEIGRAHV